MAKRVVLKQDAAHRSNRPDAGRIRVLKRPESSLRAEDACTDATQNIRAIGIGEKGAVNPVVVNCLFEDAVGLSVSHIRRSAGNTISCETLTVVFPYQMTVDSVPADILKGAGSWG